MIRLLVVKGNIWVPSGTGNIWLLVIILCLVEVVQVNTKGISPAPSASQTKHTVQQGKLC